MTPLKNIIYKELCNGLPGYSRYCLVDLSINLLIKNKSTGNRPSHIL